MKLITGANGVRPLIKPGLFRSNKQKRWTLALVGPARVGGNLLHGRSPLLHTAYREPDADQHVQIATQLPVLFNHPFGQPIRPPPALLQMAVDRPDLAASRIRRPSGFGGRSKDRVLYRKDEISPLRERPAHNRNQSIQLLDIMQCK